MAPTGGDRGKPAHSLLRSSHLQAPAAKVASRDSAKQCEIHLAQEVHLYSAFCQQCLSSLFRVRNICGHAKSTTCIALAVSLTTFEDQKPGDRGFGDMVDSQGWFGAGLEEAPGSLSTAFLGQGALQQDASHRALQTTVYANEIRHTKPGACSSSRHQAGGEMFALKLLPVP